MAIKGITPILSVSDVPASLAWFESLGFKRGFTWNEGGMIEGADDRTAHGDDMTDGVWMNWWIDSVKSLESSTRPPCRSATSSRCRRRTSRGAFANSTFATPTGTCFG